MKSRLLTVFLGSILWLSPANAGPEAGDWIEKTGAWGRINWTTGFIEASGFYKTAARKPDGALDWEKALAGAKNDAHDHLLETVQSVRIQGEMTIGELDDDEDIKAGIMDMVQKSALLNQAYGTDGRVEVTLGLSFFGGFSQLFLPSDIEHVDAIQSLGPGKIEPGPESAVSNGRKNQVEIFSGLILDARGLGAEPAMTVKILDESGNEIYGPAFVSREVAVQNGMCIYVSDLESAEKNQRILRNPLVIKALRTQHVKGSDLVIRNSDAVKIRSHSEHLAFLMQCRVIVVLDPGKES
jgi:hypothetical protein